MNNDYTPERYTTIKVSKYTVNQLKKVGHKGMSYDEIIRLLIELYEERMNGEIGRIMFPKVNGKPVKVVKVDAGRIALDRPLL